MVAWADRQRSRPPPPSRQIVPPRSAHRHPELVSGSIAPQATTSLVEQWILKQVQNDRKAGRKCRPRDRKPRPPVLRFHFATLKSSRTRPDVPRRRQSTTVQRCPLPQHLKGAGRSTGCCAATTEAASRVVTNDIALNRHAPTLRTSCSNRSLPPEQLLDIAMRQLHPGRAAVVALARMRRDLHFAEQRVHLRHRQNPPRPH